MPTAYANPNLTEPGMTNYLGVTGDGTFFGPFSPRDGLPAQRITDGLSNTVMVVEADPDRSVEWTRPNDCRSILSGPSQAWAKLGPVGSMQLMADGAVRFIAISIDPKLFKALLTFAGGEPVAPP